MPRAVVLRHELPDGSHHFDWLLEPSPGVDPEARELIAWRLPVSPLDGPGTVEAVRLPPHRRLYLEYEGPISGGRGFVGRVAAGEGEILCDAADRFQAGVRFGSVELRLHGVPIAPPRWRLTIRRPG